MTNNHILINSSKLHKKTEFLSNLPFFFITIFFLISIFAFNNVIVFDSHLYYKLSQQIISFSLKDWDMIRTPIFPVLLAITEIILGKNPLTFVFLNTLFLISGCYCVCDILRKYEIKLRYRFIAVSGFATPVVITYQHSFLSESGLLFMLILITWVALYSFSSPNRYYIALGLVMTFAYYYKPHFKYLALLIFLLVYIAKDLKFLIQKPLCGWLNSLKPPVLGLCIFMTLIYPWEVALQHSGRMEALNYFPFAMGVVPAETKYLGKYVDSYRKTVESLEGIPRGGLSGDKVFPLLDIPNKPLLKTAIIENFYGYFKAVFLTLSNYIWSPENSENQQLFKSVVGREAELNHTKIYYVPDSILELRSAVFNRFNSEYSPGILSKLLDRVAPVLNLIVAILICLLPIAFVRAIVTKNFVGFITSGVALGYLAMHSMALMCIDRYAAPTTPLVFLAVVTTFFIQNKKCLNSSF